MEYIETDIEKLNLSTPIGLTIGNFDGVHLGHQKIIQKLVNLCKERNISSTLISFNPHPITFFLKDKNFLIDNEYTKISSLKRTGLDNYISLKFDKNLALYSYEEFEKNILLKSLNLKLIFSGLDFQYGKQRKGDISSLKKFSLNNNIDFFSFKDVLDEKGSSKISSTNIRKSLRIGAVNHANKMLGRPFEVRGTVIKGDQRGRTIGIPTANTVYDHNQVELPRGVYAVYVTIDSLEHKGISNYGIRPTFNKNQPLLETHIFDFNQDIYDKELKVKFISKIREEIKFNNMEDLLKQINIDTSKAKEILKNGN